VRVLPYRLCDVFTDRPLAGNALAVFTEADALDPAILQRLARELNLSECAFLLAPTVPAADARLRIFTPTMELPFAGHPTLGTAFVLAELRPELGPVIRLETARGVSRVTLSAAGAAARFGWMTQPLPRIAGYEVVLDEARQVAGLRPNLAQLEALGSIAVTVVAPHGEHYKTRVFAPGEGIPEDPATGAAAGPTALHLARHGRIAYGDTIVIEQGIEVGRPSTLLARVFGSAGRLERVEVGGHAVLIGRGEIRLV
jgi:trans-2,3-dihydro-3-hydroxyanthranilate isomerase